jgi:hypothetical protein
MEEEEIELYGELYQPDKTSELRLSYSRISAFANDGANALIKRRDLSHDGITLGKLVDLLLFEPEKFKEEFYVFDGTKPTASSGVLADMILANYDKMPSDEQILKLIKINSLWTNIKKEPTLISKFDNEEFKSYVNSMFESKGFKLVTTEEYMLAREMVATLQSHKYSKDIFDVAKEDEEIYDQFDLEFKYRNFIFRGIIDRLIINHTDKTIQIVDLKTGSPSGLQFLSSFLNYRYYLQEAIYCLGVEYIRKELQLSDEYDLVPFKFAYLGKNDRTPLVYTVSDKWHRCAIEGFTTRGGRKYKGLNELLDEIQWHLDNQLFDLPKEVYERNGDLLINDDFIIENE